MNIPFKPDGFKDTPCYQIRWWRGYGWIHLEAGQEDKMGNWHRFITIHAKLPSRLHEGFRWRMVKSLMGLCSQAEKEVGLDVFRV